jgi:hypothetical protein
MREARAQEAGQALLALGSGHLSLLIESHGRAWSTHQGLEGKVILAPIVEGDAGRVDCSHAYFC